MSRNGVPLLASFDSDTAEALRERREAGAPSPPGNPGLASALQFGSGFLQLMSRHGQQNPKRNDPAEFDDRDAARQQGRVHWWSATANGVVTGRL